MFQCHHQKQGSYAYLNLLTDLQNRVTEAERPPFHLPQITLSSWGKRVVIVRFGHWYILQMGPGI